MSEAPTALAPLALALASGPGQPAAPGALREIDSLVQAGEYRKAASAAASLIAEGVTDVHAITACLLGHFVAEGPRSLDAIFGLVHVMLTDAWTVLHPVARRERTVDAELRCMLRTIVALLDFEATGSDPGSHAWQPADRETASRALAASDLVRDAAASIPDARFPALLSEVEAHLRAALEHPLRSADAPETAPTPESPSPPRPRPRELATTIEVSPAMATFLTKIRAFEVLVERGDLVRAAVVADDLRRTIEQFDPRVYLPQLFVRHFSLLSEHISTLAPMWENRESIEWQVMEQHYLVDLDGFIEHG